MLGTIMLSFVDVLRNEWADAEATVDITSTLLQTFALVLHGPQYIDVFFGYGGICWPLQKSSIYIVAGHKEHGRPGQQLASLIWDQTTTTRL